MNGNDVVFMVDNLLVNLRYVRSVSTRIEGCQISLEGVTWNVPKVTVEEFYALARQAQRETCQLCEETNGTIG